MHIACKNGWMVGNFSMRPELGRARQKVPTIPESQHACPTDASHVVDAPCATMFCVSLRRFSDLVTTNNSNQPRKVSLLVPQTRAQQLGLHMVTKSSNHSRKSACSSSSMGPMGQIQPCSLRAHIELCHDGDTKFQPSRTHLARPVTWGRWTIDNVALCESKAISDTVVVG